MANSGAAAISVTTWNHWLNLGVGLAMHLFYAALILFIGLYVIKRISKVTLTILEKRHVEATVAQFVNRLLYYLLLILLLMAVLGQLGVQTSSLLAVLGGMSIAIGLSLQSSLSNLASGFLLILFRPFKVGDSIKMGSQTGTVIEIHVLYTQIRTSQYQNVTIPNDQFMKNAVLNYSVNDIRRADIVIGISYDDSMQQAKEIISSLLTEDNRVLESPEYLVVIKELADSSVNILARFFTLRGDYWSAVYHFNEQVKLRFDEAGISMPYPQQDVHVYSQSDATTSDNG